MQWRVPNGTEWPSVECTVIGDAGSPIWRNRVILPGRLGNKPTHQCEKQGNIARTARI
jgi:hypothetical protein